MLITQRRADDGWDRDRLTPLLAGLLAGLAELLPWVAQWHGEVDPAYGGSPAELYAGFLDAQLAELHLTRPDLTTWRPPGRVDVTPLPRKPLSRKATSRTVPAAAPRTRRVATEPDPEHITAVLGAAASGPLTSEQIRALTGLDTAGARAHTKHLIARGELSTTGHRAPAPR